MRYIKLLTITLFVCCSQIVLAQPKSKVVQGRVLDSKGIGMPGVNILEKGTNNGTSTDFDGNYTLKIKAKGTLVISYVGFNTTEIFTANKITLNFKKGSGGGFEEIESTKSIDIAKLEFPPPKASATYVMDSIFFAKCKKFGDVDDILNAALKANEYDEMSYFSVPNGFAVVTRLEKINWDGTSKDIPERWEGTSDNSIKSFKDYLKALLFGREGYYRLIVFIVTDRSLRTSKRKVNREEAEAWYSDGNFDLPDEIKKMKFTDRHNIYSLIYEFSKTDSSEATLIKHGKLTGSIHLRKSKILTWLQSNH